jgi:hypothetical protein
MKDRCNRKSHPAYHNYGGRGVGVCQRWSESFLAFLQDMGQPAMGQTIDRKDADGDYSPENCRWATRKEQARNKRNNRMITAFGQTKVLATWCEEYQISYTNVINRLDNLGWSAEEAIATPARQKNKGHRLLTFNGKTQTLAAWARELGISNTTIRQRIRCGWSIAEALSTPPQKGKRHAKPATVATAKRQLPARSPSAKSLPTTRPQYSARAL